LAYRLHLLFATWVTHMTTVEVVLGLARNRSRIDGTGLHVRCARIYPKLAATLLILSGVVGNCIADDTSRLPQVPAPPVADAAPPSELRLDALIDELVRSNPELQALRKRYEAELTRPSQAAALPDPRVTMGWVGVGYPYPGSGLGSEQGSNIGIQVSQELPFPGKRALLSGMARADVAGEAQMYHAKELALIAQLKERFYDLRLVYESMELWRRNQDTLRELARVAEARYAAGQAMQQDVIRAGIEVSIVENKLIALEQRRLSLETEINAALDRPPNRALGRPVAEEVLPPLAPLEAWQQFASEQSPMLLSQRAVIDNRQLNLQYAHKAYYPDFDVMSGYYNQGSMKPMWEFKVQMNIPLYFGRKQRPGLEEAGARLVESQRNYRAAEQSLSAQVRTRHVAAQAARRLMELYSRRIVPESELALESSLASYETGGLDFQSVLSNLNTIREFRGSKNWQAATPGR
jgi:outer membrane protein, heavy metal efflux system